MSMTHPDEEGQPFTRRYLAECLVLPLDSRLT
jgi:hypothetical protein